MVVVPAPGRVGGRGPLADPELAAEVRAALTVPVAAVLMVQALPVDIRHASKVDRLRLGRWAERVLSGRPGGTSVKVLVTGASGMLGAGAWPVRWPRAGTR